MKTREILMYILGGLISLGFFGLIGVLIFKEVPLENKDLLNISIGALLSAFTTVVGFFYGSSMGSKDKNELIAKQQEQPKQQEENKKQIL